MEKKIAKISQERVEFFLQDKRFYQKFLHSSVCKVKNSQVTHHVEHALKYTISIKQKYMNNTKTLTTICEWEISFLNLWILWKISFCSNKSTFNLWNLWFKYCNYRILFLRVWWSENIFYSKDSCGDDTQVFLNWIISSLFYFLMCEKFFDGAKHIYFNSNDHLCM